MAKFEIDENTGLPKLPEGMWWVVSKLSKFELKWGKYHLSEGPALFLMVGEEKEERYGLFNHKVRTIRTERIFKEMAFFKAGTIEFIRDWRLVEKEHVLYAANKIMADLKKEADAEQAAETAGERAEPIFGSYPPKKLED